MNALSPLTRLAATRLGTPSRNGRGFLCPLPARWTTSRRGAFEGPGYGRPDSGDSATAILDEIAGGEARSITLSPCGRGSPEGRGEGIADTHIVFELWKHGTSHEH